MTWLAYAASHRDITGQSLFTRWADIGFLVLRSSYFSRRTSYQTSIRKLQYKNKAAQNRKKDSIIGCLTLIALRFVTNNANFLSYRSYHKYKKEISFFVEIETSRDMPYVLKLAKKKNYKNAKIETRAFNIFSSFNVLITLFR